MNTFRLRLTTVLTIVAMLGLLIAPAAVSDDSDDRRSDAPTVEAALGDTIEGVTIEDVTIERVRYDRRTGQMLASGFVDLGGDLPPSSEDRDEDDDDDDEDDYDDDDPAVQRFRNVPLGVTEGEVVRAQQAGGCQILNLDLGPIFLDLLGLQVDLSPINLDITAVPGAGNLLGNLLCAVAGLLDPGSSLGNLVDQLLTGLANLLNQLLGALGGLSLSQVSGGGGGAV